jgi:ribA/ribD-fused uncharacterized protein
VTGGPTAPSAIDSFSGRWRFLSNFFPAPFMYDGRLWPTSEHAFNAMKSLDMGEQNGVAAASTPAEAKRRGRQVRLRSDWDATVRYQVMREVLYAKFTANPGRVRALLSTGTARLVEGNTWHDQTWGDCRCGRPACAEPGQNHLGQMLMELRERLRRETPLKED